MSKVILKENIRNLGRIGDVISVKDGYAFNYLIPMNKVLPATPENLRNLESAKVQMLADDKKHKELAQELAKKIPQHVLLAREVNENGVLYGAISVKDVADALPMITDKHSIHLKNHHIHMYGIYGIQVELHHDVIVDVQLSISDTIENAQKQLVNKPAKQNETKEADNNA